MREPLRTGPDALHGRAIRTRSVVHVADISTAEPYRSRVPLAVAAVELGGIGGHFVFPRARGKNETAESMSAIIGWICAPQKRPFLGPR